LNLYSFELLLLETEAWPHHLIDAAYLLDRILDCLKAADHAAALNLPGVIEEKKNPLTLTSRCILMVLGSSR